MQSSELQLFNTNMAHTNSSISSGTVQNVAGLPRRMEDTMIMPDYLRRANTGEIFLASVCLKSNTYEENY